jgi:TonB family protein
VRGPWEQRSPCLGNTYRICEMSSGDLFQRKRFFKRFLGLSLLLHLNLFLGAAFFLSLNPRGCDGSARALEPFDVTVVPPDEAAAARALLDLKNRTEKEREALQKVEEKEKEKERDEKGQVVDLAPPREERQPDHARFLSSYDSKVEKETKGPPITPRPGRLESQRPPAPRPPPVAPPSSPPEKRPPERKVMKLAMRTEPDLPRSELERSEHGDEPGTKEVDELHRPVGPVNSDGETGLENGPRRRLTLKDLQLSDEELGRAVGGRANDYLKDVEDGDQTLLNSKRWRFATFFNRVKRQVAENWHPEIEYRRRDPSGNVYGFQDRLTILRVRLTAEGKLKDLELDKASGLGFLDDEAISAFRSAEPFPNPPKGLVDKETGMIHFRFGFLFEISRKPSFRIFRYGE